MIIKKINVLSTRLPSKDVQLSYIPPTSLMDISIRAYAKHSTADPSCKEVEILYIHVCMFGGEVVEVRVYVCVGLCVVI